MGRAWTHGHVPTGTRVRTYGANSMGTHGATPHFGGFTTNFGGLPLILVILTHYLALFGPIWPYLAKMARNTLKTTKID